MDATKPIYIQILEMRQMWRELWWAMSGHIKSEYDRIKATSVMEFWPLFDLYKKRVDQERENYKNKNHGR